MLPIISGYNLPVDPWFHVLNVLQGVTLNHIFNYHCSAVDNFTRIIPVLIIHGYISIKWSHMTIKFAHLYMFPRAIYLMRRNDLLLPQWSHKPSPI